MFKKKLFISCMIAFGYLALSNMLFYNHVFDVTATEGFIHSLGNFLTFPAAIMFGAGYTAGDSAFYTTAFILLGVLSLILLPFVYIISKLITQK